jgi:hypothetical protein
MTMRSEVEVKLGNTLIDAIVFYGLKYLEQVYNTRPDLRPTDRIKPDLEALTEHINKWYENVNLDKQTVVNSLLRLENRKQVKDIGDKDRGFFIYMTTE